MSQLSKIRYLDGPRLRRALIAGALHVQEKQNHLNDINVFPVPDGDTGTNMAGTLNSIAQVSESNTDKNIGDLSDAVAQSALSGARGNSGVILAQFFCGLSEGMKGCCRIRPQDFAHIVDRAADKAQEAMTQPKDGTILSVIRDWANDLKENVYEDFQHMLRSSIDRARTSLNETKNKLAVLKEADVVDAGGQGFVYLLEGIHNFTEKGKIRNLARRMGLSASLDDAAFTKSHAALHAELVDITFPYCTEVLLQNQPGKTLSAHSLRTELAPLGDSIVVAGNAQLLRIHVHTNQPEAIFSLAIKCGVLRHGKVENMVEQHRELAQQATDSKQIIEEVSIPIIKHPLGIVTDSAADLPDVLRDELDIGVGRLRITLDDREYIDKLELSSEEFNKRLGQSKLAKSAQAPPADFKTIYDHMLNKYEKILSIHVMDMYSGTRQSAQMMAATPAMEGRITTVNAKSVSAGLGLLVLEAARRAKQGMGLEEAQQALLQDMENTRVFVAMDTLDFAVRGGRLSKSAGTIGSWFNLKPILEFATRHDGKIEVVAKPRGKKACELKTLELVAAHAKDMHSVRFAIGHVDALESALFFADELERRFGVKPEYILPASAAVGIHSGPGACAICFLGLKGDRP